MSNTATLLQLRKQMRVGFNDIKKNPMDMNNLMAHIATMSQTLDILVSNQIGKSPMFEEHISMLSKPVGSWQTPQVSNLTPWRELGQTIKPGKGLDLSKVPADKLHFWSDQHYGHKRIIEFSNRPFKDLTEMHSALLENFKSVIKPDDVVVWIGDVSFKGITETDDWLSKFPGYNILVVGNHDIDRGKLKYMDFDEIHTSIVFDNNIVTHHPWGEELPAGFNNIHGHIHDRSFTYDRHYCACVELIDYKPITLQQLMGN
jgi:calcineurin-like phosphoesterase family protein